jgi:ABC-type glycerol-3-phosphate transport system permease component
MEKLAENDLTYFYLSHVVIVVTAVTTISLPPVSGYLFSHFQYKARGLNHFYFKHIIIQVKEMFS